MPPKKKAASGNDAADAILRYVKEKNRPYSATDIFSNLKGAFAKPVVQKILAQLVEESKINGKQYGKQWVYVAKQEEVSTLSPEETAEVDATLSKTTSDLSEITAKNKEMEKRLNILTSAMTNEEMESKIESLKQETDAMRIRLTQLRDGQQLVTDEERTKITWMYDTYRLMWRQRKKMFMEAWRTVTENLPGNPKELMEQLGIETDEAVGMDMNVDPLQKFVS
ncbi:Tat binding protein 1-interacting protein-domain-containing protein [Chytridium lagenaria]|nr:Tat binding protein 1-interacting protein-domain-containing protein [Chytridium lagenaria]